MLKRLEERVERMLVIHAEWYPNELHEKCYDLYVEGLVFHMTLHWETTRRKYLSIQTVPLDSPKSRIIYSALCPEISDRAAIEARIFPLLDQMLVLDDLAAYDR
jgi:hypothetical protein